MKEYLEYIIKSLVDLPEQVRINEVPGEGGTILEVQVAQEDLGKIIGRQGRTARALRSIIGAASIRANKHIILEILESDA